MDPIVAGSPASILHVSHLRKGDSMAGERDVKLDAKEELGIEFMPCMDGHEIILYPALRVGGCPVCAMITYTAKQLEETVRKF